MRSFSQQPAPLLSAAAGDPKTVPLTAATGDTGRARKFTTDKSCLNLVKDYLPRGRSLGTDAAKGVSL
jgi:hypothetical protein